MSMHDKNDERNKNKIDKETDFMTEEDYVKFYNDYQVSYSNRCVFSVSDDFKTLEQLFSKHSELKKY